MNRKQIAALKAAVKEYYPDARMLQYHHASDTISGYRRGYGRYILARRMCMPDCWETVGGHSLEF